MGKVADWADRAFFLGVFFWMIYLVLHDPTVLNIAAAGIYAEIWVMRNDKRKCREEAERGPR